MVVVAEDQRALAIAEALRGYAPPSGVCLVLGGDGTMLRAIREAGSGYVYFGVHCGHVGFLMNDMDPTPAVAAEAVVRTLAAGSIATTLFPRLRVLLESTAGAEEGLGVNDVYVERSSGQTCHLRVTVDGVEAVARLVCDGVVAATPLGSTAYSFSAGGPAAHPLLRGIHLTAICPHSPRLAPLLLPDSAVIRVEVLDPERRPARAVVDGEEHGAVLAAEVRDSGEHVRLAFREGHDFTATLIRKVLRA
jgi:NAD+ kinase